MDRLSSITAVQVQQVGTVKLLVLAAGVYLLFSLVRSAVRRPKTTLLSGPPSPSLLFGVSDLIESKIGDTGELYEGWAEQYGSVYKVPIVLGGNRIVLFDPKGIAYFKAHDTTKFVRTSIVRRLIQEGVGRGLLWAEGDNHKRQRKALSPAFSNAAIRNVTSVFFDSGYKVKAAWDSIIDNSSKDSALIDVQSWMSHVSLDSIGIAGFSHNFGSLEGKRSVVTETFDAFADLKPSVFEKIVLLLAFVFPVLTRIPFTRQRLNVRFNKNLGEIAEQVLSNSRREKQGNADVTKSEDKSIIGLLLKAENSQGGIQLTTEEVADQMKLLIFAGYDTTSISLTWALIELCRRPETQTQLRKELQEFSSRDPTYEELMHGLPYLDAVVHEVLRIHNPVSESTRVAAADEVIPLSRPLQLLSGQVVDRIVVCKGQAITVSIQGVNCSAAFWGQDAKEFKPERWLNPEGLPERAQEIQGHRHLLTFLDGPRTCLGRAFALAEFKAVLSVLIRSYAFEFKDPNAKIETRRSILPRPAMVGEKGVEVPLVVKRLQ